MMTTGDRAVLSIGFRGFHRESPNKPSYRGSVLINGGIPCKFPNYMKRKCFWRLETGWLVLKPKNLVPKDKYKEYMSTNIITNNREFVTWPTLKNDSLYAKKVRKNIRQQQYDIHNELVGVQWSPLQHMWVFHGDVYQGQYKVSKIERDGIWIEKQ